MEELTETEALYIIRHRENYSDIQLEKAIKKIRRLSSHKSNTTRKLKERCKELIKEKQELTSALLDSIPISVIEEIQKEADKIAAIEGEEDAFYFYNRKLQEILNERSNIDEH